VWQINFRVRGNLPRMSVQEWKFCVVFKLHARVNIFILDWKADWDERRRLREARNVAFIVLHFFLFHKISSIIYIMIAIFSLSRTIRTFSSSSWYRGGEVRKNFRGVRIKLNGFFLYYFRAIDFWWISFLRKFLSHLYVFRGERLQENTISNPRAFFLLFILEFFFAIFKKC
jgi:hypothetical protein